MSSPPDSPTALVLEDEPRYRAFLADVLKGMGCIPVLAATADEALRAVSAAKPSILLLDLNLPVMDGMTFFEKFRALSPSAPVLIITGFGDLKSAKRAIQLGVTEFISKPCDLGQLEAAIARARRQLDNSLARPATSSRLSDAGAPPTPPRPLAEIERDTILDSLRSNGGNRSEAARTLGISRRALYNKLNEYHRQGHDIP